MKMHGLTKNLIGLRFGKGVVIEYLGTVRENSKKSAILWKLKCDCGNEYQSKSNNLNSGVKLSCGCMRRVDLTGKKIGSLLVISRATDLAFINKRRGYNTPITRWNCLCDCGVEKIIKTKHLVEGGTQSCGCSNSVKYIHADISITYWKRIIRGANSRNMEFNITPEYIWELWIKQNGICALSGEKLKIVKGGGRLGNETTASLDRIDSTKGYIKGNLQWIHKKLQFMKNSQSDTEFIDWCSKVYNHNIKV